MTTDSLALADDARGLLELWREARGSGPLPHHRHISPLNLRRWIGDISVMHVRSGAKRFYVALHGANVARHIGPDFNKMYLEDAVPPESWPVAVAPYEIGMETCLPAYSIMLPSRTNRLFDRLERLVLPFCGDDAEVVDRFLIWVAPNKCERFNGTSVCEADSDRGTHSTEALFLLADDEFRLIDPVVSDAV